MRFNLRLSPSLICLLFVHPELSAQQTNQTSTPVYFNRSPLQPDVYIQLPLGSIRAKGWLLTQLQNQRDGATGHAEELYPGKDDLGPEADWLGGPGNSWEKAPYYLKGLVALAYTLDDPTLKARAQKWIDYTLTHQADSGLFGPPGMKDWWPRMPFLYALQTYFEATDDPRVIPFMSRYFRYELDHLDEDPLRDWGRSRAGDNIEIVLWLYNRTGDSFLLDLARKLKMQAYPWSEIFTANQFFYRGRDFHTRHMVSVAQALKFPSVVMQVEPNSQNREATELGIRHILREHGQNQGLSSGTEMLAGTSSVQGVETCTVVEWMQSLETAFRILHDPALGDELEKVAFNALPAQFSRDFRNHSYYTLPNQVQALPGPHGFNQDYSNGIVPSPYSGYPCCRYNMHMGWPYFVKNSWALMPEGGLAANTYGPMELEFFLKGNPVRIEEETAYPFEEQIRLKLTLGQPANFPVSLRIPAWCAAPVVLVNGKRVPGVNPGQYFVLNRTWKTGDLVTLNFPMQTELRPQLNNAVSVQYGPLVYGLKMNEQIQQVKDAPVAGFRETFITTSSPWNYGLVLTPGSLKEQVQIRRSSMPANPFIQTETPVTLTMKARRIPGWKLDRQGTAAGEVPFGPVPSEEPVEDITLVPFGSGTLRLSIFPRIGQTEYQRTVLQENFDSGLPANFVAFGGGWYTRDGALYAAANEDGRSGNSGPKYVATNTRFGNFQFAADITINSSGDGGLLFRSSDHGIGANAFEGYYVGLNAEAGQVQLGKSWLTCC